MTPLGTGGGYSGARLWRVDSLGRSYCLKAWPTPGFTSARLTQIHSWMARARNAGLDFVPELVATQTGTTVVEFNRQVWDLTSWQPGVADFHTSPSTARLRAALQAVARLHHEWQSVDQKTGPLPCIERRLLAIQEWHQFQSEVPRTTISEQIPPDLLARSLDLLAEFLPAIEVSLAPWQKITTALQPCVCDLWHDHVLFTGDRVTGIIDYGAARLDHPATDLARLIGSLVGDSAPDRQAALDAYHEQRPLSDETRRLIDILDRSGTVLAVCHWIRRFEQLPPDPIEAGRAKDRLRLLLTRIEGWRISSRSIILS